MAELEILWTPAAIWALRSLHWREGEIIEAAVQKFAQTGEGHVTRIDGSLSRMRLYAPPFIVRFSLDQDKGVLVVAWVWRQD